MIACDVVLLPSAEIAKKAVEINRKLVEAGNKEIILDEKKCFPHITLAMGCVKKYDLGQINDILEDIAASFPPVRLKTVYSGDGRAWIKLEKNRDIELLHEIVMIRLSPFFSHEVAKDMVYKDQGEEINDTTLDYIRKFSAASSFENYIPHITVGHEDMNIEVGFHEFISSELALCHLGNYCTCRQVLLSHGLSGGHR